MSVWSACAVRCVHGKVWVERLYYAVMARVNEGEGVVRV